MLAITPATTNAENMNTITASELLSDYNYAIRPLNGDTNWFELDRSVHVLRGAAILKTREAAEALLAIAEAPQDGVKWPHELLQIVEE